MKISSLLHHLVKVESLRGKRRRREAVSSAGVITLRVTARSEHREKAKQKEEAKPKAKAKKRMFHIRRGKAGIQDHRKQNGEAIGHTREKEKGTKGVKAKVSSQMLWAKLEFHSNFLK